MTIYLRFKDWRKIEDFQAFNSNFEPISAEITSNNADVIIKYLSQTLSVNKKKFVGCVYGCDRNGYEDNVIKIIFEENRYRRTSFAREKNILVRNVISVKKEKETKEESLISFESDIEIEPVKLKDINFDPNLFKMMSTGSSLDQFFSRKGGVPVGCNYMFAGDPGSGKSSICFDILGQVKVNDPTVKVGYVSAEMTEIDVKEFEQYNKNILDIEFLFINNYVINPELNVKPFQALISFLNRGYDLVVFDSFVEIQEMIKEDFGLASKKSEKYLLDLMGRHNKGQNKENKYTTFIAIQQKTKGGTYVGSKRLEHMTTAFLNIVKNRAEKKTYMYFEKNRKGEIGMKMFYKLTANGIVYDFDKYENELTIKETVEKADEFDVKKIEMNELSGLFKNINSKKELAKEMSGL